jgi:hypothetical protein
MQSLLDDVLELASIQVVRLNLKCSFVDAAPIVADALNLFEGQPLRPACASSNVCPQVQRAPGATASAWCVRWRT